MAFLDLIGPMFLPKAYVLAALTICPAAAAAPQVVVAFEPQQTEYSEEYGSAALKTMLATDIDSTLATDERATTFGVTTVRVTGLMDLKYNTMTDHEGNQCLYIDTVTVHVRYTPSVYVSSDITNMACSYKVTVDHEQQHVAIDYKLMHDYMPYIQRELQGAFDYFSDHALGPYPVQDFERHRQTIFEQANIIVQPAMEKLRDARRKRQGVIDTPENYRRESAKCPGDMRIIQQRFGGGRE